MFDKSKLTLRQPLPVPRPSKLKIDRQRRDRGPEDAVEDSMVCGGTLKRHSRNWGLPNGFDDIYAPVLLAVFREERADAAGDVPEHNEFNTELRRWAQAQKNRLRFGTGLSTAQLADDLSHDIELWEPHRVIERMISRTQQNSIGKSRPAPARPAHGAAAAYGGHVFRRASALQGAPGATKDPDGCDTSSTRNDEKTSNTSANKKACKSKTPCDKMAEALYRLAGKGVNVVTTHRASLHRLALSEAGIKDLEIGSSPKTFERALKKVLKSVT